MEAKMDASIFLAQALGLYFLIVGFALISNGDQLKGLVSKILEDDALLFVTGFIALILGVLMVISHNLWVMDWRIVITLVAWLMFIKGVVRVVFPKKAVNISKKWIKSNTAYYTTSVIVLLLGFFLGYHGFLNSF